MIRLIILILIAVLIPALVQAGATDPASAPVAYFTDVPDLPLPPGFVELPGDSMVFETASGRILDLTALGAGQAENHAKIAQFYAETLPALGWIVVRQMEFTRDGEQLHLRLTTTGRDASLHIRMRPKS